MALTPEQEQALAQHLSPQQTPPPAPTLMDKIRQYVQGHNGLGTTDVRSYDEANQVEPTPQPVQHMADGGVVQPDPSLSDYVGNKIGQGASALGNTMMNGLQHPLDTLSKIAPVVPGLQPFGAAMALKNIGDSITMPSPRRPTDPMAKPFAQEDYQSASYKPPFGNEAQPPVAQPVPPTDNSVDNDEDPKSKSKKVVSSHPGFDQDELEKYLLNQKGEIDKYGADAQAKRAADLYAKQHGLAAGIQQTGADVADGIMQGVARAGNPGWGNAVREKNQQEVANSAAMGKNLEEANLTGQKAKMALDSQSNKNPLGAASASAMLPVLKSLYPGKTDAEYMQMANNPAVAEALLPEEVKLKDAQARISATNEDRAFRHQMAEQNMDYRKDKDYTTRLEKDTSGMSKDANFVKAQGTLDKLSTAKQLLEAGNVNNATAKQALQTALTFVATGGQRVNETEMKQLGGAHTVMNRVNQWIQGIDRGTLTPKDYHDMKQVIGIYENGANSAIEDAVKRTATTRAAREHISPDQARQELGHPAVPAPTSGQPTEVNSQEAYNALPSGAMYTSNGILHRKK